MSCIAFTSHNNQTAVLAVDTLGSCGRESSKMLPLPHLTAIVAGRGRADDFAHIAGALSCFPSFDEALKNIEKVVHDVLAGTPHRDRVLAEGERLTVAQLHHRHFGNIPDSGWQHHTTLLVGYSHAQQRIVATSVMRQGANAALETHSDLMCHLGPPLPAQITSGVHFLMATDSGAMTVLREQCLSKAGHAGYGGRGLVARIDGLPRPQIMIRDLGPIERRKFQ